MTAPVHALRLAGTDVVAVAADVVMATMAIIAMVVITRDWNYFLKRPAP